MSKDSTVLQEDLKIKSSCVMTFSVFISICKYMYKLTHKKDILYNMWISGFNFVTVLTYRHMRKNVVVRKLKFKIWQYLIFFHANWLVLFIFNFMKKISIVSRLLQSSSLYLQYTAYIYQV